MSLFRIMQPCSKKHQCRLLFFSNFRFVYLDSTYPAKNQVAKDTKRYSSALAVNRGNNKPNLVQATINDICLSKFEVFK